MLPRKCFAAVGLGPLLLRRGEVFGLLVFILRCLSVGFQSHDGDVGELAVPVVVG